MGVINGVIEFVASLFDLVGFLSGLLSGDAVMLWQAVKKEFERLKEEGAFTYLFKAIGKFFDTLSKRYNTTQGKYTIVKHLGEDLIGIVEVVLGAIAVFKAGKVIISNSKTAFDSFKKAVDDIFEKRNKEFEEISPDNVKGKGLYGGKVLSKKDIENWKKRLLKKFGTKLEKVDSFDKPDIQAQFDANTNTIKYKDDVTEYIMSHESFHAEEMSKIGFDEYIKDAPLKGVKESDFTVENWQRLYKREKYVYDKLLSNKENYNLYTEELQQAFFYFDGRVVLELEKRNIKIPKI